MIGKEVFCFAVHVVPHSIELALEKAGLPASSTSYYCISAGEPKNYRCSSHTSKIPPERVISNLANYGNTSATSIPLALDKAVRSGKVQTGHTIAPAGFGAGLTWGSAIVRWS